MGIVQEVLVEFETSDNQEWYVELNDRSVIHIHINNIRFALTSEEFNELVDLLDKAESELRNMKNEN